MLKKLLHPDAKMVTIVLFAVATGTRKTKPTNLYSKPPIVRLVFIPCHFSKSLATLTPARALNARKTAALGLGPSELPDTITQAMPINQ